MNLEKKLAIGGMIIGGVVGAAIGLDYCIGKFDLTDMESFWWQARAKAAIYTPLITTFIGVIGGKYTGKGIGKMINYFT